MIQTFKQLLEHVRALGPKRVAVVAAEDAVALHAAAISVELGIATPLLFGNKMRITNLIEKLQLSETIGHAKIVHCESVEACVAAAVKATQSGEIDMLLKGHLRTDQLLRAVLKKENGLRNSDMLSDVLLYEDTTSGATRLIGISDGGLNPLPNFKQKISIIKNAISVMRALAISCPKIGLMSATEKVTRALPSTVDAEKLSRQSRELYPDADVFGPLALDNALLRSAAEAKGIRSSVAGAVDCMIVPNIEAGNLLGKAVKYLGGSACAHVVVGAKVPVLIPSRVESAEDKRNAIALGALMHGKN